MLQVALFFGGVLHRAALPALACASSRTALAPEGGRTKGLLSPNTKENIRLAERMEIRALEHLLGGNREIQQVVAVISMYFGMGLPVRKAWPGENNIHGPDPRVRCVLISPGPHVE
jgi:hypothetical protein